MTTKTNWSASLVLHKPKPERGIVIPERVFNRLRKDLESPRLYVSCLKGAGNLSLGVCVATVVAMTTSQVPSDQTTILTAVACGLVGVAFAVLGWRYHTDQNRVMVAMLDTYAPDDESRSS